VAESWLQQVVDKCPAKYLSSTSTVISTRRRGNVGPAPTAAPGAGTAVIAGFTTDLLQNLFKFSSRNSGQLGDLVSSGLQLHIDFSDEIMGLQQVYTPLSRHFGSNLV
jgi:hypothetical protein